MHECVHTQSISQIMHAPRKTKTTKQNKNSTTFGDYIWEMLQNTQCCNLHLASTNTHYENTNNV